MHRYFWCTNLSGKDTFENLEMGREDSINVDLKQKEWDGEKWILLAQERYQRCGIEFWLKVFRAFSSVVRQMPGYTSQRWGTVRILPNE
jgi:hypothetical protein